MDYQDQAPLVAGPPVGDIKDWRSPFVVVNGHTLSVQEYNLDPSYYNTQSFPKSYIDYLCQSASTPFRSHINNLTTKIKEAS